MEQGCPTGQVCYDSPQQAAKAKKRLAKRGNAAQHKHLNHFRCHACHAWHLGRPRTVTVFKSMRSKGYNHY